MKLDSALALSFAAAVLASCAVGPDYAGPPDAAPLHYRASLFLRGPRQHTVTTYPPSKWWRDLQDQQLSDLIELTLADSPNVEIASARVLQARASAGGARARLLPQVSSDAAAVRARLGLGDTSALNDALSEAGSAAGAGTTIPGFPEHVSTSLYSAGLDASWEIDIFGGTRRAVEGAVAQADAAQAGLDDAKVQLAAQVAQAYVGLRASQQQMSIAVRSANLQRRTLDLTKQKAGQGTASEMDLARLETQLATTEADVPPLRAQIDQALNQIAILCGLEPGQLDKSLQMTRSIPTLPTKLAVGNPADMLRRRPDIRQAERQLAASNAGIGQAVAGYFPKVTLTGLATSGTTDASDLLKASTISLVGGPTLQWNVLDFGRTSARVAGAKAQNQQALAQYRQTVLSALEDAETSLSRFRHQNENVAKLATAEKAASRADDLARDLYKAGTLTLIDELDIERQQLQSQQALARAQADRVNDFVALQKSLGLGWQTEDVRTQVVMRP